jgi:hypothetical protein
MKTRISPSTGPAAASTEAPGDLRRRLSRLYALAEGSDYVFGSPLGPARGACRSLHVPRFVYFGPLTSEASPRLAVIAGLGRHDLPASRALTAFVEGLARQPDLGHALNLTFCPVVNVLGLLGGAEERDLSGEAWARPQAPEIELLAQDARLRAYQGYIQIVTTADDEPAAWLRSVRTPFVASSGIEVFSSSDFDPWTVRFESLPSHATLRGPLSLADDLPFAPFGVEIALPADWPQARLDATLADLLRRLITRYRGFLAYGQNL